MVDPNVIAAAIGLMKPDGVRPDDVAHGRIPEENVPLEPPDSPTAPAEPPMPANVSDTGLRESVRPEGYVESDEADEIENIPG